MDDWRTNPRTGKGQIVPWKQLIQTRLDLGATMRQVYDELVTSKLVTLGYRQFVRYVHELTSHASRSASPRAKERLSPGQTVSRSEPNRQGVVTTQPKVNGPQAQKIYGEGPQPQRKPMTRADLQKIRSKVDDMDLDALINTGKIIYKSE